MSVSKRKGAASRLVGSVLALAGLALAASALVPYILESVASDYGGYVDDDAAVDDGGFPSVDWEGLLAVNPDVVGWVRIEGTSVDYPVVQASADDPQFYLQHGLDRSWNGHGIPYVDCDCPGAAAANVLVYGHNMIDGSMFTPIADYTDQGFFNAHREVLFMTPSRNYRLDAVCAREVSAWSHNPRLSFSGSSDVGSYLSEQAADSPAVGHVPTAARQTFEFVCCSYGTDNGRTLLFCVEPTSGATEYRGGYYAS